MTGRDAIFDALLGVMPSEIDQQAIDAMGVDLEDGIRLWRALGFPEPESSEDFDPSDFWALGEVAHMMQDADLDINDAVALARGVGSTMSRLAEWQAGLLTGIVERRSTEESREAVGLELLAAMRPRFEALLYYAWRRHIAAAAARSPDLGSEEYSLATVGFADIVAFSALSNEISPEEVGELVEVFETNSHDAVSSHGGRVIKGLGDSVLFTAPSPPAGIAIAWEIIDMVSRFDLPDVRTGVVYGSVVKRMGDVYGPAVNLASRLTGVARRNRVITDRRTADLLPQEYVVRVLPAREVRGFGVVEPVSVSRPPAG